MPKVTIDGIEIEVPKGTTILQAARMIGPEVAPPTMCYYSKLKTSGGYCRTCIVKVTKGSAQNPNPMPKPVASCRTEVMDGMEVQNVTSPEILEARKGVVEFLLINHPLDCPVCDQAGECSLQDLGYEHGAAKTRYEFKRREFERIDIGKYVQLHMTRCILCYRCVKTAEQITDNRVHGVIHRGDAGEISTYIEKAIDNEFSGNVIDVCPVGALTDKTFRFKQRVWFTKPVEAHRKCTTKSATGQTCSGKVRLWYKGEDILRVTARKDQWGEVEEFICNDCRFEHKKTSDWTIEGPSPVNRHSVISQNHYNHLNELKVEVMKHQKALGFININKRP
ncbi:MAG: (2Fe-2S)-binding protein [Bacteroidetes bacterium]|nr:(2Fe-2S)-binding protein [Bacteroidota bacterium]